MKFFFLMMISPGSFPIHGIFSPINRKSPIRIIRTPSRMSILPKGPKPSIWTPTSLSDFSPQRHRHRRESHFPNPSPSFSMARLLGLTRNGFPDSSSCSRKRVNRCTPFLIAYFMKVNIPPVGLACLASGSQRVHAPGSRFHRPRSKQEGRCWKKREEIPPRFFNQSPNS